MRIASFCLIAAFCLAPALGRAADTPATPSSSNLAAHAADSTATAKTFSDTDRAAIEGIVHDYLTKEHPEVIMEAAQEMQKREMAATEAKSQEAITKDKDKLFDNPSTPVGGNPKGDVTIVEFFDYNCGYCKMSEEGVEKILKEDKKVRFIYKDYPILGPASVDASKASLASARQDKYVKFHDALMGKKDHVSDATIEQAAKEAGLDYAKLKKDMADPAIQKIIDDNLALGNDVGVRGTPMFIIGSQVYPGALQYPQLKKAVDDARAGDKKS